MFTSTTIPLLRENRNASALSNVTASGRLIRRLPSSRHLMSLPAVGQRQVDRVTNVKTNRKQKKGCVSRKMLSKKNPERFVAGRTEIQA